MLVFKAMAELKCKIQVVVGRKNLRMFQKRFKCSTHTFYDDLVSKLFENVLHRKAQNVIYFSARSSKKRLAPLLDAVRKGVERFEEKWARKVNSTVDILVQTPSDEPCLQIIDYALWAVHRAYTKGEMRYFETIRDKFSLISDPYDRAKYPNVYYDGTRNPFDIKKTSPL
jgi:hypothetical protein